MRALRRTPIRVRLALVFALVMSAALLATGFFVYTSTRDGLDEAIDRELRARLAGVVAILGSDGEDLGENGRTLERVDEEGFVQVLRPSGSVVASTASELGKTPVLSPERAAALSADDETRDIELPSLDDGLRLAAARTADEGAGYIAIVAASLHERESTLEDLRSELLISGPFALLIATAAAFGLATAALRPVERMRRDAAQISSGRQGPARLEVDTERNDEIARLGETLNEMLARIEAAFDRERSFVSDASHELRTPLSILKMEIDVALAEGRSREELVAALRSAGEETDRLSALAEDLLVLARTDRGQLPIRPEPFDGAAVARRIAGRFEVRAAEAGRSIDVVGEPDSLIVADEARVEQLLSNLIDNALRHGEGAVTVTVASEDSGALLAVTDSGPGFPSDFRDRAFERFTRGDDARTRGGSGLGLALVAAIAAAHGGEARIDSGAARVWVRIPAGEPSR